MIVAKNTTVFDIKLEDMGITIPGSSIIDLMDTFTVHSITESDDLKACVEDGTVVINDGIQDLNKEDGLKHITYETAYEDKVILKRIVDGKESSTYLTSWQEKLKLDLVDVKSASYLLNWSFELKSNDNTMNNFCESRVLVNSNEIATNSWLYSKYQYFNGNDLANLVGDISVTIEYRRQGNYQPVYIRKANISLTKLS